MITIGAVWLYVAAVCLNQRTCSHQSLQRPYPTMAACQKAKVELLRKHPELFVACDK